MKIRIKLPKTENIQNYIVVILLLYASGDTLLSFRRPNLMYFFMLLLLGWAFFCAMNKKTIAYRTIKVYAMMMGLIIVTMVVNVDFGGYSMFITLLIALLIAELMSPKQFLYIFDNTLFFISSISLVLCLLYVFNNGIIEYVSPLLHINYVPETPWGFRLYGIFREPAMFCIYLGITLFYNVFWKDKIAYERVIVYLISLVLSGSSTGYIAVAFLVVSYALFKKKGKNEQNMFIMMISLGLVGIFNLRVIDFFIRKIDLHGASSYSTNSRIYSVIGGLLVGITHPLGAGALKSGYVFDEIVKEQLQVDAMWANGMTYMYGAFGLLFVLVFLYGIYLFGTVMSKSSVSISFLLILIILLCGETMTYSSLIYVLLFMGYKWGYSKHVIGEVKYLVKV